MANRTRAQLSTDSLGFFPNNTSQLISPQDLRDWITNGIESFVTQKDKSTFENAFYENRGNAITATSGTTDLVLANGNFVHVTGTTPPAITINSFGTLPAGSRFILCFDIPVTIAYNATSMIIPGAANIVTSAGDCIMLISEGSGNWRIVSYFPGSGLPVGTVTAVTATTPLSSSGGNAPDISITQADSTTDGYLSSSDWSTFYGKGDVTATGTPSAGEFTQFASATSIEPAFGSANKILLGTSDSTLNIQEITLGTNLTMSGTTLNASGGTGTVTGVTASTPLSSSGGTAPNITIQDAAADGTTKGAATFANSDFQSSTGVINLKTLSPSPAGTYTNATVQVDATGRVTSASSGTGGGITALTGDVTASGTGSVTATISNGAVDIAMLSATGTPSATTFLRGDNTWQTPSGSGTVNTGTFNRLAYYSTNPTGTAVSELPTAGTSGQILQSNGTASAPSWVNAVTATLTIGSSIVSGATAGRLLLTTTSGANQVLNQDAELNYDTTNNRLGVGVTTPTARFHASAGVAANGQVLLEPSALGQAGLTGTTDGTMWYDTTSNNSSLYLRKLYQSATSILTKFITLDKNPDFITSSTSGVIVSDANGTLSKSADLTALGIYAQTNTPTAITTGSGSLIGTVVGSTTLSTNFFATGKTIKFYLSGLLSMANSGGPSVAVDIKITDGTTTVTLGTLTYDTTNLTSRTFIIDASLTCRSSGSNPVFGVSGQMIVNHTAKSQETVYISPTSITATSLNTSSALTLQITATWTNPGATSSISSVVNYANYIN